MIDTTSLKQNALRFKGVTLSPKIEYIDSIDFSVAKKRANKSVKEVKEYSGSWTVKEENKRLKVELDNIVGGLDDEVSIPTTGWTWHTHPKGCPNLKDCSIIPPSANDFQVFAERHNDQHMVITKERIYWVKALKAWSEGQADAIFKFYKRVEKYFDENAINHDEFDVIFSLASKYGNFFKIYNFKNKNVVFVEK